MSLSLGLIASRFDRNRDLAAKLWITIDNVNDGDIVSEMDCSSLALLVASRWIAQESKSISNSRPNIADGGF